MMLTRLRRRYDWRAIARNLAWRLLNLVRVPYHRLLAYVLVPAWRRGLRGLRIAAFSVLFFPLVAAGYVMMLLARALDASALLPPDLRRHELQEPSRTSLR